MLCHALVHTYKFRSKKTNKKQRKVLGKSKYVTPDQTFVGIPDGLTINDEYLQLIERLKM